MVAEKDLIPLALKLQEPTDEENDMLDLAFGLTPTSRLGCQVILKPELEGMTLQLPAATRNMVISLSFLSFHTHTLSHSPYSL